MVEINLLPWRQRKLIYENKILKLMLIVSLTFTFILVFIIHINLNNKKLKINHQIELLKNKLENYTPIKKTKSSILSKQLLLDQEKTLQLLTKLGEEKNINNTCLTSMTRESNKITFIGNTQSAADLTHFLSTWKAADLFSEIKINYLNENSDQLYLTFQLTAIHGETA